MSNPTSDIEKHDALEVKRDSFEVKDNVFINIPVKDLYYTSSDSSRRSSRSSDKSSDDQNYSSDDYYH